MDSATLFGVPAGWVWVVVAIGLALVETLGMAGFLLGAAAAALVSGIVAFLLPGLAWSLQVAIFALLALILTGAYWKFFRRFNERSPQPQLNQRMQQMVGTVQVASEPIGAPHARVQIGDTLWEVRSEHRIEAGTKIRVVAVSGMVLVVEPVV